MTTNLSLVCSFTHGPRQLLRPIILGESGKTLTFTRRKGDGLGNNRDTTAIVIMVVYLRVIENNGRTNKLSNNGGTLIVTVM